MCVICAAEVPAYRCLTSGSAASDASASAEIFETIDVTSSWDFGETNYTLIPGDTFFGYLHVSDIDAFSVDLVAGTSYIATLTASSVEQNDIEDTVLLLVNETGTILQIADDIDTAGGNYYSELTFSVPETGTYKLVATSFNTYYHTSFAPDWGYYQLSLDTQAPPVIRDWTLPEIAGHLTFDGWGGASYRWSAGPGSTITVNVSGLTAEGQALALAALDAWSAVSGLNFETASSAQITFTDHNAGAYASFSAAGGFITTATVNVSTSWLATYGTALNGYGFQTYLHEVGHALGLAHGGFYDGSASYGVDNHYLNDSWQLSVMSYFDQVENSTVNASRAYVVTPQLADIAAIQLLYGAPGNLRTADTVYGVNSNVGGVYDQIGTLRDISFTILDNGGTDTLDFSDYAGAQTLRMNAGSFSSVSGESNNMAIAAGTIIENAITGAGNDLIYGNAVANEIRAGGGDDMVYSGDGDDIVYGGDGADRLVGEAGDDTLYGGAGDDILKGRFGDNLIYGEDGNDRLFGSDGGDDRLFAGAESDTLYGLDGNDRLEGGDGDDFLYGGRGNDIVIGGTGDDVLRGNRNDDILSGSEGTDRLYGGGGNDSLFGGLGRDFLVGENGDDMLDGGEGDDNLTGGAGMDVFVFGGVGYGYDRILDFEIGVDKISFGETSPLADFSEVLAIASDIASGAKLTFGPGDVLLIMDLTVSELAEDDFYF